MAVFCSKCGAQLEGSERFCVKCGNDVTAGAAPAPIAAAPVAVAPAAQPIAPPPVGYAAPPAQGYGAAPPPGYGAPPPAGYGAPGPIPVMGMPPPVAPQKKNSLMWGLIAIALAGCGWYYYYDFRQTQAPPVNAPAQPATAPTQPATAPTQPGGAPGPAAGPVPAAAPGPAAGPGPVPGGAPAAPAGGGANAALVNLQSFSGRWVPSNGTVEVSDGKWSNNSTVNIQSATLECVQYDAAGSTLTQMQTTLNGPTPPQTTSSFGPFPMGAIQQNMSKVNCGIVGVNPGT
jgi:hypothetical protein